MTAGPARAHVEFLSAHGVGLKQIAKISGVSHGALWKLVYGKDGHPSKRIRQNTAERILAVAPADAADGAKVSAGPTWVKIDELAAAGVPKVEIARRLGQTGKGLQLSRGVIWARHARSVAAMHAEYLAGTLTFVRRSRHGDRTVTVEPPGHREATPEPLDSPNETAAPTGARSSSQVVPAADDADRLLIEFVEILESRIDQAEWRAHAACRGRETWMFFPARGDHRTGRAAQRVCNSCVVREQCLAVHLEEPAGIWGATTGRERRALRSDENAA